LAPFRGVELAEDDALAVAPEESGVPVRRVELSAQE
jgi:hypothetical protein